ncbi:B3/4 domain-containing protein [Streptomyces sp. TLI_171]|uniref:B3/B4 domain-containing protein n=1 Tax=Streptomyces sp. TLI_171 TaxID=1938859 RepID=UPI000C184092|nr:phenylalanine--tRNA ligase beta subunit-related protein [Streptomyces sp. TLI_171]RKE18200.1 DNA/RNA-binding domain of Phe-tRNA-synthetase-like protein [Streptomyces sp. TLI_171]
MTVLHLHPAVAAAHPAARIAVVTARGVRGTEPWPGTEAALVVLESLVAEGSWRPADESDPRVEVWHAAYRSFGTNPRRIRPSVDALGRRLAKQGVLPRINPAVDSYNAVSVRHGLPAGAFDLAATEGDPVIRFADGTERFTPLGEPDTVEHPRPGEVVYTDDSGVLTRHWNHRDAHRTRVTEHAVDVLFVLETLHADGPELDAATQELTDLLTPHCAGVAVRRLDARHLSVEV